MESLKVQKVLPGEKNIDTSDLRLRSFRFSVIMTYFGNYRVLAYNEADFLFS